MTDPLYLKTGNAREQHYFYQNDHLGTPQKLMSTTGAIVWDARYEAFGQATPIPLLPGEQPVDNPLRFAGQYHDPETGWHYNWHRYYAPELGRYITEDPIGLAGGINVYGYAIFNPNRFVDPEGQVPAMLLGIPLYYWAIGGTAITGTCVATNCMKLVLDAVQEAIRPRPKLRRNTQSPWNQCPPRFVPHYPARMPIDLGNCINSYSSVYTRTFQVNWRFGKRNSSLRTNWSASIQRSLL